MENTEQNQHPLMGDPMFKENLRKMSGDMGFYGIFTIIVGAFSCLGIISAVVGIPMIIAGLRRLLRNRMGTNNAIMRPTQIPRVYVK